MRTRPLGSSGPEISVVGLGGMPLSIADRPPESDAIAVIHAALDGGLTFIDTADVYCLDDRDIGHNERLISKALRSWSGNREGIVVATKGGMTRPQGRWERDVRPEQLHAACRQSLVALGVEAIDLYQLHAPDPKVPFTDSVGALADLREQGLIQAVGLSNVSVAQIEEARTIVPIASVQNRLNPFFREALETGVVDHCAEHGIAFIAYSPVGGGRLHKKLPHHPVATAIAARLGITAHQVVLAWVLAQGPTVFVIPGARSGRTIRSSAAVPGITLAPRDLKMIDDAEFSRA